MAEGALIGKPGTEAGSEDDDEDDEGNEAAAANDEPGDRACEDEDDDDDDDSNDDDDKDDADEIESVRAILRARSCSASICACSCFSCSSNAMLPHTNSQRKVVCIERDTKCTYGNESKTKQDKTEISQASMCFFYSNYKI